MLSSMGRASRPRVCRSEGAEDRDMRRRCRCSRDMGSSSNDEASELLWIVVFVFDFGAFFLFPSSFSLPFSLLGFVRCRRHPSLTPTHMDAARLTYIKTPHTPTPPPTQKYCSRLDWTNDCLLHLLSTITFFLLLLLVPLSGAMCVCLSVSACLPSPLSSHPCVRFDALFRAPCLFVS